MSHALKLFVVCGLFYCLCLLNFITQPDCVLPSDHSIVRIAPVIGCDNYYAFCLDTVRGTTSKEQCTV